MYCINQTDRFNCFKKFHKKVPKKTTIHNKKKHKRSRQLMWVLDPSPFNFTSFMQLNFSPLPNLQNKILVPLHINPGSSAIQFHLVKNITSQHNSNYSARHIISIQSEIFTSLNYTFHSIYSNTNPSTKSN